MLVTVELYGWAKGDVGEGDLEKNIIIERGEYDGEAHIMFNKEMVTVDADELLEAAAIIAGCSIKKV